MSSPDLKLARKIPAASAMHGRPITTEAVSDRTGDLPWNQIEAQGFTGAVGENCVVTLDDGTGTKNIADTNPCDGSPVFG